MYWILLLLALTAMASNLLCLCLSGIILVYLLHSDGAIDRDWSGYYML